MAKTYIVCFPENKASAFKENVAKLKSAFPKASISPRPRIQGVELTTEEDVVSLANAMDFVESVEVNEAQQFVAPPGSKVM